MRILVALGGNALLRRGEPMTTAHQIVNIRRAATQIANLADHNELVIAHGNGPQVGLLAAAIASCISATRGGSASMVHRSKASRHRPAMPYSLSKLPLSTGAIVRG